MPRAFPNPRAPGWLRLVGGTLLLLGLLAPSLPAGEPSPAGGESAAAADAAAGAPQQEDAQKYSAEELEQIVGPIALYPDVVLASLLPASTATVEIVMAARLLEKQGDKALDEVPEEAKSWDPGVQAMLQYPDILRWMNENLEWVEQLGYAVSMQQDDVLTAIQSFRRKTKDAGNLESNDKLKVTEQAVEGEDGASDSSAVIIESADPETMYVPSYDPHQVTQPYYGSQPLYGFGTGIAVGAVGAWAFHEIFWGGRHRHNTINIGNSWHAWGRPRPPIHGPGFRPWRPGRPPRPIRPGFGPGRPGLRPPVIRPGRPVWRPGPGGIGGSGPGLRPPRPGPGLLPGRPGLGLGGGRPNRPGRPGGGLPGGPGLGLGGPARPGIVPLPTRPAPGVGFGGPGRGPALARPGAGLRDVARRGAQSLGGRGGARPLFDARRPRGIGAGRPRLPGPRRPGGLLGGGRKRGGLLGGRGGGFLARPNAARGLGSLGGRRGGGLFGGRRGGGLLGGGRRGGGLLGGGRRGGGLFR